MWGLILRWGSRIGMSASVVRIVLMVVATLGGSALLYKAWGFVTQRELVKELQSENLTLDKRWSDEHTALLVSRSEVIALQTTLESERDKKQEMERIHHARDKRNKEKSELLEKVQAEVAEMALASEEVERWLTECKAPLPVLCQTAEVMGVKFNKCTGHED